MSRNATTLDKVLTESELELLFNNYSNNVILTTPLRRYIETIENHYIHSLKGYEQIHANDIKRLKAAIHKHSPSYDISASRVLEGKTAHMLNMFVMSTKNFKAYCEWLFPVIDTVVEMSSDREDQKRYAGALSEFCLDIFARANDLDIKELQLLETERKPFIKRMISYIKRKL